MKRNKINIIFLLPNLLPGGAERVISVIAQNLDKDKFNSTLLVIGYSKDASYDVKNIDVIFLEKSRVLNGVFELFMFLKTRKPNIVVSAIEHLNSVIAYLSIFFPKTKFIAREVNVLSVLANFEDQSRKLNLLGFVYNKRFNFFDKVICQSQDMLDDFRKNYRIKDDKLIVINNPITDDFKVKNVHDKHSPIRFITVARLELQKGHHRILEGLSRLKFPFHYTLIGSGKEEKSIFDLIDKYNLNDKVNHISFTQDVAKHLSESDLYLQGSYVEGFPNSVIESCMVGTPILAFDAPGGINEIIYPDINGKIVSNVNEFVTELEMINSDYCFMPNDVSATVNTRYSIKEILPQYEGLFISTYQEYLNKK